MARYAPLRDVWLLLQKDALFLPGICSHLLMGGLLLQVSSPRESSGCRLPLGGSLKFYFFLFLKGGGFFNVVRADV